MSRPTLRTQLDAPFRIRGYHPLWRTFPDPSPMTCRDTSAGLFPVRSPLLRESRLISFPAGTEMFQFPGFASQDLCIQSRDTALAPVGFPIRTSPDQSLVADSPKLFAGSNVLHRLQLPRHPPYALIRLTIYQTISLHSRKYISSVPRATSFAAPHTGYTLDSQLCVYLTHTT